MTGASASKEPRNSNEPAWHTLTPQVVAERFGVDVRHGLKAGDAGERLQREGPNEIPEGRRRSLWRMFLGQFMDFMILVLLAASVISGLIGSLSDTSVILVIVLLNAIIGTVQEYRAEQAVAALRIVRDTAMQTVPARELVTGDVVVLEAGDAVPADLRLVEAHDLVTDEAALTGESVAVQKHCDLLPDTELPIGDRHNMAFKGTAVLRGRTTGVVVATGLNTELGRIAVLLRETGDVKTPLQRRLARFGQRLALAVLAICALIFAGGLLRGEPTLLMFLTAVSLAVAAIPEALPAVVTVALALGARRMSRARALIRHLPAVETLGSVTYICSDKTGTLTENRMRLEVLFVAGARHTAFPDAIDPASPWRSLGQALALNNDVYMRADQAGETQLFGDPTEVALFEAATRAGFDKAALSQTMPRLAELAFDSERKSMSTLHRLDSGVAVYSKGAPEAVIPRCVNVLTDTGPEPLVHNAWLAEAESLSNEGYRVLAVACRRLETVPEVLDAAAVESELTLLGLVALLDPPREEAAQAVADCRSAGIRPVMITGDHPGTARAIAERLKIAAPGDRILTGAELTALDDAGFERLVTQVGVYARVSPEQKIRIVQALQGRGEIVAMTGDGVNDAPALKRADIGVAMGGKGTDVAREAAAMVLLDDNFATIVAAVREGRRIYDNIRKFVKYAMTTNAGEIWVLFLAPFLGLPLPLLPVHILWINLLTDGLPGLALGTERAERAIMARPPRAPKESIFAHGMWQHMIWVGILIGGLTILAQAWALQHNNGHWQSIVFTVLTFSQLTHVLAIRSERESLFSMGIWSNRPLLGAVVLTVLLQLAVLYVPVFNPIFKTAPLSLQELAICLILPLVVLFAVEIEKWLVRRGVLYVSS
ncbi:MAG: cation-translocating P-type ATPase [Gammaproteobacteria bacterium]